MSEKNIYQRIAAAMAEVDYIQKEKKNGMRYSIVSHDAVTAHSAQARGRVLA